MAKTISELKAQSSEVKNASAIGENTATRVGQLFGDIVEHVEQYENTKNDKDASQDAQMQSLVSAEESRAKGEERGLQNQIHAEEIDRKTADTYLGNLIQQESSARETADENIRTALANETARAQAAEQELAAAQIYTAKIKDGAVTTPKIADGAVTYEKTDIIAQELGTNITKVPSQKVVTDAVKKEETERKADVNGLVAALASESIQREQGDENLNADINGLTAALASETIQREQGDENLNAAIEVAIEAEAEARDNAINNEAQARSQNDALLNQAIVAEKDRAEAREQELTVAIQQETERAMAAEGTNAAAIEAEAVKLSDLESKTDKQGIYDVSTYNSGAVFESLSALLNDANLSTLIPASVRCGGMSIRFIQGSVPNSDNKYVQYRLMADEWSTTVANWQGVDDEPITASDNMVISGGVHKRILPLELTENEIIGNTTLVADEQSSYIPSSKIQKEITGISITGNIIVDIASSNSGIAGLRVEFHDSEGEKYRKSVNPFSGVVRVTYTASTVITKIVLYSSSGNITEKGILQIIVRTTDNNGIIQDVNEIQQSISGLSLVKSTTSNDVTINLQDNNGVISSVVLYQATDENAGLMDSGYVLMAKRNLLRDKIQYSRITYADIDADNQIVSSTAYTHVVAYIPVEINNDIIISCRTVANKYLYYGFTNQLPALGVTLNDARVSYIGTGERYEAFIKAPISGYFVLAYITGYNRDLYIWKSDSKTSGDIIVDDVFRLKKEVEGDLQLVLESEIDYTGNSSISNDNHIPISLSANHTYKVVFESNPLDGLASTRFTLWDSQNTNEVLRESIIYNGSIQTKTITPTDDVSCFSIYASKGNVLDTGVLHVTFYEVVSEGLLDKFETVQNDITTLSGRTSSSETLISSLTDNLTNLRASIFDGGIIGIAYSVLSGAPGNSEAHFMRCINTGFVGLKADMRLTSDGEVVLCHDEGYTFDVNGRITTFDGNNFTSIHDLTLSQVLEKEFAEQVDGQYIHPCTLDRFLYLCKKYNEVPYITLREEEWSATTAARMYVLLKKYRLVSRTIINLYTAKSSMCAIIRNLDANLMMCNTLLSGRTVTTDVIDNTATWGCEIICFKSGDSLAAITDEIRNYAYNNNIVLWAWSILNSTTYELCLEAGVTGFQLSSLNLNTPTLNSLEYKINNL